MGMKQVAFYITHWHLGFHILKIFPSGFGVINYNSGSVFYVVSPVVILYYGNQINIQQ